MEKCQYLSSFRKKPKYWGFFLQKSQNVGFFALFEEDMNRNGIDDQNDANIIDEPQDLLEEDVEDDDDNNNEVVHIFCLL